MSLNGSGRLRSDQCPDLFADGVTQSRILEKQLRWEESWSAKDMVDFPGDCTAPDLTIQARDTVVPWVDLVDKNLRVCRMGRTS